MRRKQFTLIELMIVIVIGVIIVSITVPAFNRIIHGNAVTHGAGMVSSYLTMARTEACARRKPVAVVFILGEPAIKISYDSEVSFRAFRACYVKPNGDNYAFEEWLPASKWEAMPQGAWFDTSNYSGKSLVNVNDGGGNNIFTPATTGNVIIFEANGKVVTSETAPSIKITEGTVRANAPTKNDAIANISADNYLTVKINQYTGIASIAEP